MSTAQTQIIFQHQGDGAMSDGTPYTPWQCAVIAGWHARNPTPLISAYTHKPYVPWGVYCLDCKTPSVMIPADKYHPNGYCICPQCSVPATAVLEILPSVKP